MTKEMKRGITSFITARETGPYIRSHSSLNVEVFIELFHGVLWSCDGDAFGARVRIDLKVVAAGICAIAEENDAPEIPLEEFEAVSLVPTLRENIDGYLAPDGEVEFIFGKSFL